MKEFGPVYIKSGEFKGRIGFFDDDYYDVDDDITKAVIYFGSGLICKGHYLIDCECLGKINSNLLLSRINDLSKILKVNKIKHKERISYLEEMNFINGLLVERMYDAIFKKDTDSEKIFISHSSKDKNFARSLAVDLKLYGYNVWLDEWEIRIGEAIPQKVSKGLDDCNYVAVILSPNSLISSWVGNEWQAKYWEEIEEGKVKLLPILYQKCNIPTLLKHKRYADFTGDYTQALEDLVASINSYRIL